MSSKPEQRSSYLVMAIGLLFLAVLCAASFVIVRPFIASLLWGLILSIATWPAYAWFRRRLGGRRSAAAALMTLLLAVVLLGPLALVGAVMTDNVLALGDRVRAALQQGLPPPEFLDDVPLLGPQLSDRWRELSADGQLTDEARQLLRRAVEWLLGIAAALGAGVGQLALSIFCTFFFFRDGEAALKRLTDVLQHVAGDRATHLLSVAYGTLKGVVYGVIGSVLAQATLAAFGYWLSGVPVPLLLGVATGFFGIIPGGPTLVWLPAAIWLFHSGETTWGIFLVVWSAVLVANIDNVIRPMFVARGSVLPLLLVLIGILGGAIAFGLLGIFLGPTVLAILYALMREWSPGDHQTPSQAAPPAAPIAGTDIAGGAPPARPG